MIARSNIIFLLRDVLPWRTRIALIKDFLGITMLLSNNSFITKKIIFKIIVCEVIVKAELEDHCSSQRIIDRIIDRLKESNSFRKLETNIDWSSVNPILWEKQAGSIFKTDVDVNVFSSIKLYFRHEKIRISRIDEESFTPFCHGDDIICHFTDLTTKELENVYLDYLEDVDEIYDYLDDCKDIYVRYYKNNNTGYWEHKELFSDDNRPQKYFKKDKQICPKRSHCLT